MNVAEIYIITNLINNKQYVGQTVKGYLNRFEGHCYLYNKCKFNNIQYDKKKHIDEAIAYYGKENFKVELLEVVPEQQKYDKEIYYINKYDTYRCGYNFTIGGDINPMLNEKTLKHHRDVMKSDEVRSKISERVQQAYTPELRQWFSKHSKDIWYNSSKEKQQQIISGFTKYNNSRKQKVATVDEDGNILQVFESASDACKYYGRLPKEASHILIKCDKINKNGKRAKHFGQSWTRL